MYNKEIRFIFMLSKLKYVFHFCKPKLNHKINFQKNSTTTVYTPLKVKGTATLQYQFNLGCIQYHISCIGLLRFLTTECKGLCSCYDIERNPDKAVPMRSMNCMHWLHCSILHVDKLSV